MEIHDAEQALSEARSRFDGGDERGALEVLEKLLSRAKKDREADLIEQVLPVARELAGEASPPIAARYERLVYSLDANLAYARRAGPRLPRADRWGRRRRALLMIGICVVLPGLVLYALGNSTIAIVWTELGLFASPLFFVLPDWKLSTWLCVTASMFLLGSAALVLLGAAFVSSVSGTVAFGLFVALVGGALALAGALVDQASRWTLVLAESAAALLTAGAVALFNSDRDSLSHISSGAGSVESVTDLTPLISLWSTAAIVLLGGVAVALTYDRPGP